MPKTETSPEKHRRPWKKEEDHLLEFFWGSHKIHWIAKRLQRTPWAVTHRALDLKLGPFERGTISMKQFCERSGFLQHQVIRAARKIGTKLHRAQPGSPINPRPQRRYAIDDDQQEALLAELLRLTKKSSHVYKDGIGDKRSTKGRWGVGKKPVRCNRCGTKDRPHFSGGLCASCYNRRYKKRQREALPDFTTDDAHFQKILDEMGATPSSSS